SPDKLVEHLEKVCCQSDKPRETQILAMCWGLAHAYRVIFNTVHCPQGGEGAAEPESEPAGTAAGPGAQAAPVPVASTSTAAGPGGQAVPISVAPIRKTKYTKKSPRSAQGDNEPGPSREQEEEPEVTIRSLSLSELRDMRKDFSRIAGEQICTWLLR
ncbi:unnamed protein product, partial [Bubo scandiacus]